MSYQARRSSIPRRTLEDLGLTSNPCSSCGGFNPSRIGEPRPVTCNLCGASIRKVEHDAEITRMEQAGVIKPDCLGCRPFYADPRAHAPAHNAKPDCESGGREHCTCSGCF